MYDRRAFASLASRRDRFVFGCTVRGFFFFQDCLRVPTGGIATGQTCVLNAPVRLPDHGFSLLLKLLLCARVFNFKFRSFKFRVTGGHLDLLNRDGTGLRF